MGVFWLTALAAQSQDSGSSFSSPTVEVIHGTAGYDIDSGTYTVAADGRGQPTLSLGYLTITADHIEFNENNQILYAKGDAKLWDRGTILRGSSLQYFLDREEGSIWDVQQAELSEHVYFTGKQMTYQVRPAKEQPVDATEPVMEKEFNIYDGTVTTNDMPVPYYYVSYDRIKVLPNVRWWAHDMLYYAGGWPLFYVPYYTRSLREHKVVYSIDVGHYSKLGFTMFNQLSISPSEEYEVDLFADYYSDAGFGKGARLRYDIEGPYGPRGELYGYHIQQEAPDNDRIFDGADRYNIYGTYEQDLPYDLRLIGKGHRISDSEYRWDYRSPEWNRDVDVEAIERDNVSFISLSKAWEDQSLRITGAHRFDTFYYSGLPYVEREPQIHYEYYTSPVLDTKIYADLMLDFGRYRRELGQTYPLNQTTLFDQTDFRDEVDRFDTQLRFSYPYTFSNRLHVDPWIGARLTSYMDPARWTDDPMLAGYQLSGYNFEDVNRAMLEGGVDLSTRQTIEFDPFLDRYSKMRAVLEPVVQYGYFHPDRDLEEIFMGPGIRFPYIDPTDEVRYQMHRVSMLLRTRIQGKNQGGGTGNFMDFAIGTAYDYMPDKNLLFENFEYFDDPADYKDHRYMDLVQSFNIYPFDWLAFGNNMRWDIDDNQIRSSYYYTRVQPIQPLRLSFGFYTYRFPFFGVEEQRDLTFQIMYDLSTKWQVYYSSRYDIDNSQFRRNYIGIMRDMYDYYALFQIEHESHPTLGDEMSVQLGVQFWGIGGRRGQSQPTPVY